MNRRTVSFLYTNGRGEVTKHFVIPKSIVYRDASPGKKKHWLLIAHDLEKKADHEFLLRKLYGWIENTDGDWKRF